MKVDEYFPEAVCRREEASLVLPSKLSASLFLAGNLAAKMELLRSEEREFSGKMEGCLVATSCDFVSCESETSCRVGQDEGP